MAESETEIQTLERLEAALARIAAHAGTARPASGDGDGQERAKIAAALDRIIAQLREALDDADRTEQG